VFKVAGMKQIKFGDNVIDYADEFKLYMTSRYSNPHYLPELSTKVQIINFNTTFEGLQEQLLNLVVKQENPSLDEERRELIQMKITNT
jgi:dynein heavy chain, axonemal